MPRHFPTNAIWSAKVSRSLVKPNVENQAHYNGIVELMRKNANFEVPSIDGACHVHLNEPTKVSGIL